MLYILLVFVTLNSSQYVSKYLEGQVIATVMKDRNIWMNNSVKNQNFFFLVGISPNKCASSSVYHALKKSLHELHVQYNIFYPVPGIHPELKYWDRCIPPTSCSWTDYLKLFSHKNNDNVNVFNSSNYNSNLTFKYILYEKTTSLLRYYHAAYLLSGYSDIHNMYFYISLRNPINRAWSEYWMHLRHYFNRSDEKDIAQMIGKIFYDFNSFSSNYPKYNKVLNAIRHNDIDEKYVIKLWIDASYDLLNNLEFNELNEKEYDILVNGVLNGQHSPLHMPTSIIGCYYPQILMWYHIFKSSFNGIINVSDRIKIFQMEWIAKYGIDKILKQLLLWIDNDKPNKSIIGAYFDQYSNDRHHFSFGHRHRSSWIPHSIQIQNITLKRKLNDFYSVCNHGLYRFLQQHPDLLLLNHTFDFDQYYQY